MTWGALQGGGGGSSSIGADVVRYNSTTKKLYTSGGDISLAAPEYTWDSKPAAFDVPRGERIRIYDPTTFSGTGYNPMGILMESDTSVYRPVGEQVIYSRWARADAPLSTLAIPGTPPAESLYTLASGTYPVIPGNLLYPGMTLRTRIHFLNKATANAASGLNYVRWGNAAGLTDPQCGYGSNGPAASVSIELDIFTKCLAIGVNGVGSVLNYFIPKNSASSIAPPYVNNAASIDTTKSWTLTPSWANTNTGDTRYIVGYTVSILPE